MSKTVAEFVQEVVDGEMGCGSVYLDGFFPNEADNEMYVGVARDSMDADYRLETEPTPAVLDQVAAGLTAGGLSVFRDQNEWQKHLSRYA